MEIFQFWTAPIRDFTAHKNYELSPTSGENGIAINIKLKNNLHAKAVFRKF